ncbi:type VII secretion-associated protein [Nocardia sp. CA-135398]|uniref:type VII secretion-associated protein n=1 Tax=Nocardia sp. CA-135398 TaxID=3239977 RepID=UPI003D9778B6
MVTDTRIWARGPTTHWDAPPSVVLGSNGDLVVGEPLTPPTQVSSAVQYVDADRIALVPRVPSVAEAMTAVVGTAMQNLGVQVPCDEVTVVLPTEWGGRRRAVVDNAVRGFASNVVFEDMAVRAVAVDAGAGRSRRVVVLEFGSLSTTATSVIRGHQGIQIECCAHEPNLAVASLEPDSAAFAELSALIGDLLAGQPADVVQAVGISDPTKLELIRSVVLQVCGPDTELRPIAGVDLVRRTRQEPAYQPGAAPLPTMEWMQPLRQRAAAIHPPQRNTKVYAVGGIAAIAVVAAAVAGTVAALGGSDGSPTRSSAGTSVAASTAAPISAQPSRTTAPNAPFEAVGRLRFQVPIGWRFTQTPDPSKPRIDLVPSDGTRKRITVIQTSVAPGAGYEQVAANLDAQMKQRPIGTVSELKRDVVFGGKSGLSYTEQPGDGSTVRWQVLVEHGLQVSIGCQYLDGFESIASTCEQFAASVQVTP